MLVIKEEFVGGPKWSRAVKLGSADAIQLWVAMKCYCSQHPDTEGFVPEEDLDSLPGAPRRARKALQALIDCGRMLPNGTRGPGLVDAAEGGWRLHDYLDHSPSPEEIELRREKGRLRKQAYREHKRRELAAVRRLGAEERALMAGGAEEQAPGGAARINSCGGDPVGITPADNPGDSAGHVPRDNAGHVPWDKGDNPRDIGGTVPGVSLAGACPPERACAPAPTRAGAPPNPTQPNPTKNLRGLSSTIRDPRARQPGELGHPVVACPAHRKFASDHELELEPLLEQLRAAPSTAGLSQDEIRTRLGALLADAAAQRRAELGGAA